MGQGDNCCDSSDISIEQKMRDKIKLLPPQEKIKAIQLFKIHLEKTKNDEKMDKEISEIENKYFKQQQPLLKQQHEIICGDRVPSESELVNLDKVLNEQEKQNKQQIISDIKAQRIDNYWVKVFENCEVLCEEMRQKDKPILKYLNKISLIKEENTENFTYTFEFAENEYFSNLVLTKKFFMKDAQNPIRSEGTEIQWKDGKDITKKIIKKKQKNKKTGQTRVVEKQVKEESLFNFFNSTNVTEEYLNSLDDDEVRIKFIQADEQQDNMEVDLEIAQLLDDEAIPYSIEYYLGIVKKEDHSDMGDDEDDDDDSDQDSDDEPIEKKKKRKSSDKKEDAKDEPKPECKQQ